MSAFVLDVSVALCWCFKDEATPETDTLLKLARAKGAAVPDFWRLEIANVLVGALRHGRVRAHDVVASLQTLKLLQVETASDTAARAMDEIFQLAAEERLTTYDAAYLDLAIRRRLPLATKDKELIAAAPRRGVPLILKS